MTLDDFFAGHEESRRIFESVRRAVAAIGPADIRVTKSQVAFRQRTGFAFVRMPGVYVRSDAPLVLTLSLRRRDDSPRWKEIVQPYPGRFTHHLELRSEMEILAQRLKCPIVASDVSPRVLRLDRRRLEWRGLYDRVSLLAFDARSAPFKADTIETLTTNLGFANIREPGGLLRELRRIVSGRLLAVSHFYPENGDANARKIGELGLAAMLFHRSALACFAEVGWEVEVANSCLGAAHPTPAGVALEGAVIDTLPVAQTTLEWCTVAAK